MIILAVLIPLALIAAAVGVRKIIDWRERSKGM